MVMQRVDTRIGSEAISLRVCGGRLGGLLSDPMERSASLPNSAHRDEHDGVSEWRCRRVGVRDAVEGCVWGGAAKEKRRRKHEKQKAAIGQGTKGAFCESPPGRSMSATKL